MNIFILKYSNALLLFYCFSAFEPKYKQEIRFDISP